MLSGGQRPFESDETVPCMHRKPLLSCRSAVELVKIVRETLEALFDLHLGIPEEVVAAAGQGLDSFLQRWVTFPPSVPAAEVLRSRGS